MAWRQKRQWHGDKWRQAHGSGIISKHQRNNHGVMA